MDTEQKPIASGFGAQSTAEEVAAGVDLRGKLVVITGGYAGIGLETVRVLAKAGASVIAGARDMGKAEAALRKIKNVELLPLDLAEPESIGGFSTEILRAHGAVHLLINNAGIMAAPLMRDRRGYEMQFATTVWCAVSPQLDGKGGVYCADCDIAALVPDDSQNSAGVLRWATDKSTAGALWELSEKLVA